MHTAQFFTGLLLIVLSIGFFFAARSRKLHGTQLSRAQTLDLRRPAPGRIYGKFQGTIIAETSLTAPYSGRPSVIWSARLEKGTEESDEDGTTTNWDTVWSKSAATPFHISGTGELWFDEREGLPSMDAPKTFDQYIRDASNPIIAGYAPAGRGVLGRFSKPNFHAVETSFAPSDHVFFIGPVETVNGIWVARPPQSKEYSVLTWKNEQQVRGGMGRGSFIWSLLSLLALVAGVLAIIASLS